MNPLDVVNKLVMTTSMDMAFKVSTTTIKNNVNDGVTLLEDLSKLRASASTSATIDIIYETTYATKPNRTSDGTIGNRISALYWTDIALVTLFVVLIVITVIGNTLVILSVITTRRLRTVTNCFVMSLAVADWLVGLFVMPPAVAVHLMGTWELGWILCDIWISMDVLLCTASILSLCAISIDRYLAVTQPLNYSRRRRSKRLALFMILVVWILALAITCPPILGWYEPGRRDLKTCRYNQNLGYVIFSAMGSFFIPMTVMIYVYVRISCVVASRHDHMAEIEVHKKCQRNNAEAEVYFDHDTSEQEPPSPKRSQSFGQLTKRDYFVKTNSAEDIDRNAKQSRNGLYELVDCSSRTPSLKRYTAINSKQPDGNWSNQFSGTTKEVPASGFAISKQIRVHQKSMSNRILSLKRENKTTQTLSIVVGGFIACWLPFFVCYLITPFIPEHYINPILVGFLTWLGWFNSAVNPFIYAFYSVDFRTAFWRLTFRKFCKNKNSHKVPFASNTMSIKRFLEQGMVSKSENPDQ
ncbi:probable G-protein coupled receptor No18 [Phlebotomus argentipes]|uniref:probable G-protein coupled receptor No18 n=1 Tax=Phlebotomus argentipes TaxID=94469 RepID=UPI002892DC5D|nr:probable G-protein coupled receptor No18 [Phlebotomus argentipes]